MRTSGRTWRWTPPAALAVCLGAGLAAPSLAGGAATWLPPGQLSDAGQSVLGAPAGAAAADGTVVAAWTRSDGSNYRIEGAVRPPGGPFGPLQFLSAPGANATMPAAAFDAQGNAIVVWSRNGIIQAASRPAGGSFGAGQDLSLDGEGADFPQVAFDSQGDAVVLWRSIQFNPMMTSNVTIRIYYSVRSAGGSFGLPHQLDSAMTTNSPLTSIQYTPAPLATDAHGDVFALWESSSSTSMSSTTSIRASVLPHGGSFSGPVDLIKVGQGTTMPNDSVESPTLAADPAGDAFAAWRHITSMNTPLEGKLRPAGGSFEAGPETITASGNSPQVAFDSHGNAIAVFANTALVREAPRPFGGAFGLSHVLATASSGSPAITFNAHDDAIAAWVQGNTIQSATRPAGGNFGARVQLSGAGGGTPNNAPSLAADGQGDAAAIWSQLEGGAYTAQLAAYDDAPPKLDNLTIPSSGFAGSPFAASVTPLDVWSPVPTVAWTLGDGASASGASISHTYGAVGHFPISVTAIDAVGNSSTPANGATEIVPAPPPVIHARKATISGLGETNSIFTAGPSSTPLTGQAAARRHKKGTVFLFRLDQPATVKIAIQRKAPGRRVGRSCRPDSRKLRRKPRCTRIVTLATLTRTGHTGLNKVSFTGRIRGKALKPGRYQAAFTAVDAAGASAPKTLGFTIVRR